MKKSIHSYTGCWLLTGAVLAILSFLPLMSTGNPGPLSPLPVHTLALATILGITGISILLPILFILQFLALHKRQNFLHVQTTFLVTLWVLTPLYFWLSMENGLRYLGARHVWSVATIHITGLILLSILALIALNKHPSIFNNVLNILLFFFFFWGAFPVLGELL